MAPKQKPNKKLVAQKKIKLVAGRKKTKLAAKKRTKRVAPKKIKAQSLPPIALLQKLSLAGKKVDLNFLAVTQFSEFAVNAIVLKSGLSERDIPIKQITYFLKI